MKNSLAYPHLLRAPLFEDVAPAVAAPLLDRFGAQTYPEDTVLLSQGEKVRGMHMIAHGIIEVSTYSREGNVSIIHQAARGEVMGEVEALADRVCAATCTTARNATVLFCPTDILRDALTEPLILRNIMRLSHARLIRDNHAKYVHQFYPVERRLSAYLLMLGRKNTVLAKSQSYLANIAGCSRQTVNRELGVLRDQGVIALEKGVIRILDIAALEARVDLPDEAAG